jgi:tetraacyldisaccharide 4'-kinase
MRGYFYRIVTGRQGGFLAALIKSALFLLSLAYGIIIRLLIFCSSFDQNRFNLRIISAGNITVGGTGKTSLVELISRYLKGRGNSLVILTRGYKRKGVDYAGDEPRMLAKNLADIPVIIDKNRARSARRAVREYNCDTAILDDGFQQWHIKKDLDIVVIDSLNPFGNRHMLPRGLLREPLSSLKRGDIFVLSKTNFVTEEALDKIRLSLTKYNPRALIVESIHKPVGFYNIKNPGKLLGLGYLKKEKVVLLSGIGDPASFLKTVAGLGVEVGLELVFADHHYYTGREIEVISDRARNSGLKFIVTTEKDAARISQEAASILEDLEILVLRIELKIVKNEELFFNRLLGLYSL